MSADYMEALRVQLATLRQMERAPVTGHQRVMCQILPGATPTWVSPWVGEAINDASLSLPLDNGLEASPLPCPAGFALLQTDGRIPHFPTREGERVGVVWLLWGIYTNGSVYLGAETHDPRYPDRHAITGNVWEPGEGLEDQSDDEWLAGRASPPPGAVSGGVDTYRKRVVLLRSLAFALWSFMLDRRVTTVTRREFTGSSAVRARQADWTNEPIVQVVELRASESRPHDPDAGHESVEWSCRWAVRGHWRRQPYPSKGIVQARWIPAHIKGPAGKPLRAATKLLAVVR